jgi:hypothetical protein
MSEVHAMTMGPVTVDDHDPEVSWSPHPEGRDTYPPGSKEWFSANPPAPPEGEGGVLGQRTEGEHQSPLAPPQRY